MNQSPPGAPHPYYNKPSGGISRQNVKDLIKKLVPKFAPTCCLPWPAPDAKRSGGLGTTPTYGEYEFQEGSGITGITIPVFNLDDDNATFSVVSISGTAPTIASVVITPGNPSSVAMDVNIGAMTVGDSAYITISNPCGDDTCTSAIQVVIIPAA